MKLLKYLNEESADYIVETLDKECSDIIKIYSRAKWCLLRGEKAQNKDFISRIPRIANSSQDSRKPASTPEEVHDFINKWFDKKFGWPVRNGVFTTGKIGTASDYGTIYLFFPTDGYKFVYSKSISDLYSQMPMRIEWDKWTEKEREMWFYEKTWLPDLDSKNTNTSYTTWETVINKHHFTDKNLEEAVHEGVGHSGTPPEVVFKCKKYYGLSYNNVDRDKILTELDMTPMKRGYY